jgi:hypothetical protein
VVCKDRGRAPTRSCRSRVYLKYSLSYRFPPPSLFHLCRHPRCIPFQRPPPVCARCRLPSRNPSTRVVSNPTASSPTSSVSLPRPRRHLRNTIRDILRARTPRHIRCDGIHAIAVDDCDRKGPDYRRRLGSFQPNICFLKYTHQLMYLLSRNPTRDSGPRNTVGRRGMAERNVQLA